jgi:beta-N-acetylhexosaminidase
MDTTHDLISRVGQLFVVGFAGQEPPAPLLNFISEEQIGGFILFEDNCPDHNHTREVVDRLTGCLRGGMKPFVAVDQEGGRVSRIRGIPAEFRAPADYAAGGESGIDHFKEDYSRAAVYLESLGFNLNLFPVVDIFLDAANDCLRDRCFGNTPELVARFVQEAVEISRASGLFSCLKHFPGLGDATIDPHEEAATAGYDRIVWEQREAIPFRAGINAGADLIMTTHLYAPAIDDQLVTASEKVISELIRKELAFDGPIITDDLIMKGAEDLGSPGERAVRALNAGHDLLLFGRDYEAAMRAHDFVVDACRRSEVPTERLQAALDRVAGLRYKLGRSVVY